MNDVLEIDTVEQYTGLESVGRIKVRQGIQRLRGRGFLVLPILAGYLDIDDRYDGTEWTEDKLKKDTGEDVG